MLIIRVDMDDEGMDFKVHDPETPGECNRISGAAAQVVVGTANLVSKSGKNVCDHMECALCDILMAAIRQAVAEHGLNVDGIMGGLAERAAEDGTQPLTKH